MSDQAYITLSWVVLGLAVAIALPALFFDWARQLVLKRRRCPKCWYNMTGAPGLSCSECGRTVKRERHLRRARRRWRFVVLAAIMLIGSHLLQRGPAIEERGWVAAIPTSVLVYIAPFEDWPSIDLPDSPGATSRAIPEIDSLAGDLFLRTWDSGTPPTVWQWRVYLSRFLDTFPGDVRALAYTRDRWTADSQVAMTSRSPFPLAMLYTLDVATRVRIVETDADIVPRDFVVVSSRDELDRRPLLLGLPPAGADQFRVEIEVLIRGDINEKPPSRLRRFDFSSAQRLWIGTSARIQVVERAVEIMQPHVSAETDENIRRDLQVSLRYAESGQIELVLKVGGHERQWSAGWALGLDVEVRRGNQLVATGSMLYRRRGPRTKSSLVLTRLARTVELEWCSEPPPQTADGDWRVTLRGSPEMALYDLRFDEYWSGELEFVTDAPQ